MAAGCRGGMAHWGRCDATCGAELRRIGQGIMQPEAADS
jgi:hypothetical protein